MNNRISAIVADRLSVLFDIWAKIGLPMQDGFGTFLTILNFLECSVKTPINTVFNKVQLKLNVSFYLHVPFLSLSLMERILVEILAANLKLIMNVQNQN